MPSQKSEVGLFSLPLETRLRIYEFVLVREPQIIPHRRPTADPPVASSILRTCKRIHSEASEILYSKNTFLVLEPERIFKWSEQIGRVNIKNLRSIRIFVHAVYCIQENPFRSTTSQSSSWYKLLDRLAKEATGLRHVYIYWDAEETCGHYGAEKDVRFVRELAKIQGLQSMVIAGYCAIRWPRYLAEKMGVLIEEEDRTQHLSKYQRGTENLAP